MSTDEKSDTLKGEILKGCKEIANFINESERTTFYMLEKGQLPATKIGRKWRTTKTRIRKHLDGEAM